MMIRLILKRTVLSLFFILLAASQTFGQEMETAVVNLTETLDLTEKQVAQVQTLMVEYRAKLDGVLLKHEGEEEPDVGAMIGEVRDVRDAYRKDLKEILSKEQYEGYLAAIDSVLTDMFNDLAEIRLMDVQKEVGLSDDQLVSLIPVVSKGLKSTVQLLFENAGGRLSVPKKIKISKHVKKIEKERRAGMEIILTPDQMALYDAFKEEQKASRKKK